jgi:hypothetical protein
MRLRRSRGADDHGQMMILAAVVLLIGFLALAGMMARVSQVASQTAVDADRPILRAIGPLSSDLDQAIDRMVERAPVGLGLNESGNATTNIPTLDNAVQGFMRHMQDILEKEGLFLDYDLDCASELEGRVVATLSDGETWIQIRSRPFPRVYACDTIRTTYVSCTVGTLAALTGCANVREGNPLTNMTIVETGTGTTTPQVALAGGATTSGANGATSAGNILLSDNIRAGLPSTNALVQRSGFTTPVYAVDVNKVVIGFEGLATAPAAIAYAGTAQSAVSNRGVNTVASPSVTQAGNFHVAAVANGDAAGASSGNCSPPSTQCPIRDVTAVTGMGLTWTQGPEFTNSAGTGRLEIWYSSGTATTGAVTATFSGLVERGAIAVTQYSNVDILGPLGPIQTSSTRENTVGAGSTTWQSNSVTGSTNGRLVVAVNGIVANGVAFATLTERAGVGNTEGVRLEVGEGASVNGAQTPGGAGGDSVASAVDWQTITLALRPMTVSKATLSYTVGGVAAGTPTAFNIATAETAQASCPSIPAASPVPLTPAGTVGCQYTLDITLDRSWTAANLGNLLVEVKLTDASAGAVSIDHVFVNAATTSYTWKVPAISASWNQPLADGALQKRYLDVRAASKSDSFAIQVCAAPPACNVNTDANWVSPGYVFNTGSTATFTSYYTTALTNAQFNGGNPQLRIKDLNTGIPENPEGHSRGTLVIDYIRLNIS